MTLGRTSTGAIKIKTDSPGLRAVGCACCGPTDFQPCRDCPPVLGDWTFSISGDLVQTLQGDFQHPVFICPSDNCNANDYPPTLPPRVCLDVWDAYSANFLYQVALYRRGGNRNSCGWNLDFTISGNVFQNGDICAVNTGAFVEINGDSPIGSYAMSYQVFCYELHPDGPGAGPPTEIILNKTTTVTVS